MTENAYILARLQRLELTIAQQAARIRELENDLFAAQAQLAAADHVTGVPV